MSEICRIDIVSVNLNRPLRRDNAGVLLAGDDSYANCFGVSIAGMDALPTCTVLGYFMRPGEDETILIEGAVEGNAAYVELPAECYQKTGPFSLALKVCTGEAATTVRIVDGYIKKTQTDTVYDPMDVVPTLDELLAKISECEAATEAANTAAKTANDAASAALALLNDAIISASATWSSKKIAETFCQPFEVSGNPVQCHPVEGYPLDVTVTAEPTQEGSPTLEAPQPVTVAESVTVTRSADSGSNTFTVSLPEGFMGGTVDVTGGKATDAWARVVLDGTESWSKRGTVPGGNRFSTTLATPYLCAENERALCSAGFAEPKTIGGYNTDSTVGVSLYRASSAVTGKAVYLTLADISTVETLVSYLSANPITLCYMAETATETNVTPQAIPSLHGVNTLLTDAVSLTVKGAEDPKHTIDELRNAIISLTSNQHEEEMIS